MSSFWHLFPPLFFANSYDVYVMRVKRIEQKVYWHIRPYFVFRLGDGKNEFRFCALSKTENKQKEVLNHYKQYNIVVRELRRREALIKS